MAAAIRPASIRADCGSPAGWLFLSDELLTGNREPLPSEWRGQVGVVYPSALPSLLVYIVSFAVPGVRTRCVRAA